MSNLFIVTLEANLDKVLTGFPLLNRYLDILKF